MTVTTSNGEPNVDHLQIVYFHDQFFRNMVNTLQDFIDFLFLDNYIYKNIYPIRTIFNSIFK